ncbi:MAG: hypothetical protein ACXWB0_01740 [Sulfuricurvum sp.]
METVKRQCDGGNRLQRIGEMTVATPITKLIPKSLTQNLVVEIHDTVPLLGI